MARQRRRTEPLETVEGLLVSYDEVEPRLIEAETRGRRWLFELARERWRAEPDALGPIPGAADIFQLHKVMFESLIAWAGQSRRKDKGVGGIVHVPWPQVRVELRQRFANLDARVRALDLRSEDVDVPIVAEVIAQAHHDFQYVHPFPDTNGRTGRVLDHHFLWITFGLVGDTIETAPFIEYFPTERHEDEYYDGLREADAGYMGRITTYYSERVEAAFAVLEESLEAEKE